MKRRYGRLNKLRPQTVAIHGDSSVDSTALRPPIDTQVAYRLGSLERGRQLFAGEIEGQIYGRMGNETTSALERRYAKLEGAEAALATSSGMAAITSVALGLAHSGGHIVSSNRLYGGVYHLFRELLPKLGIETTFVENPFDQGEWEAAIRENTRFLYVENPSNPLIDVFDVRLLADVARRSGLPLVVDSTLATPVLFRPLEHGADIGVISLTKYVGDGEAMGGAVFGKQQFIKDLKMSWFRDMGFFMSPYAAHTLCSRLESLHGRMREHTENAAKIVDFLSSHKKVRRVFYPTQGSRADINTVLMPEGFGGLLAVELKGGKRAARGVLESLKLFWHAPNIGESRSLVIAPALETHAQMTPGEREEAGIPDGMLRLSIGREDSRDLIDDLKQALKKA